MTSAQQQDLIDRLADKLFACTCSDCVDARIERLLRDLRASYGCVTVEEVQAALRRRMN